MVVNAPSRWIRLCAIGAVIAASIVLTTRTTTANPAVAEVRTTNPVIRALLAEAARLSPTFRHLIETIESSDGIVYVESGVCGHGTQSCLATSITPAGTFRLLRILINTRRPRWDLMASIGHELRHAIEVLANPALISSAAMFFFYAQESGFLDHSFETEAAIETGSAVRREIKASVAAR
jgi:hypothetical protein